MSSAMYQRMRSDPRFQELVRRRGRFAWTLAITVLVMFFGYILVVAFLPASLATPAGDGSAFTVGILAELFMFAFFWVLTALYVRRANGEFDRLTKEIIAAAQETP
jgi:uncharacterized membrane protein (DUF485 family)